jgi:ABC-type transport system involved in multi-copper enzyme maturation permease subunit
LILNTLIFVFLVGLLYAIQKELKGCVQNTRTLSLHLLLVGLYLLTVVSVINLDQMNNENLWEAIRQNKAYTLQYVAIIIFGIVFVYHIYIEHYKKHKGKK